ncbi:MAG TPA: (d)CMP kinase [Gammaproteobacteria bacterium]
MSPRGGAPGDVPVITIDGPTGSGKGTISRALAVRLGWHLLDSGALYRLVALEAQRRGVALDDAPRLAAIAEALDVTFGDPSGEERVLLAGEDVTAALRTEECGAGASRVAAVPEVRAALLARQRAFARPPGLVADGRDMGTTVFPDASLKVFLTASPEERARRRHKQLKEKGIDVSLPDLSWDIAQRDRRDANRAVAPLRPADDARLLDSTSLSPEEVIARIVTWLEAARG